MNGPRFESPASWSVPFARTAVPVQLSALDGQFGGVGADDVVVADLLAVLQQLLAEDECVADREALLARVDLRERVLLRRVGERACGLALGGDRDGGGDDDASVPMRNAYFTRCSSCRVVCLDGKEAALGPSSDSRRIGIALQEDAASSSPR